MSILLPLQIERHLLINQCMRYFHQLLHRSVVSEEAEVEEGRERARPRNE